MGADKGEDSPQGSWREWARHILAELTRLNGYADSLDAKLQALTREINADISKVKQGQAAAVESALVDLKRDMVQMKIDLAMLRVKAGFWGGIAGAIPVLITLLITLLVYKISGGKIGP